VLGTATCNNYSMRALSYSSATGPVQNPWLREHNTGGSTSGGSAFVGIAKVKAWREKRGIVGKDDLGDGCDMAVGGDQGGSIRLVRLSHNFNASS
jgi:amidase